MTVRVGVNGFGRIGRNFLRAVIRGGADIELIAVNDVTSADIHAQLLRYDSTHGPLGVAVAVDGTDLVVGERRIAVLRERDPSSLPWEELGVQVVIESTGVFTSRADASGHLKGGASRVIISAPSRDADATLIIGVNDANFDPNVHQVVSNASCTTNCFVPMVKVIYDAFGLVGGLMTTVHAYTNDQNLLDLPHRDPRRARAAAINIVPASTGAARSTQEVLPQMAGLLGGSALRVPVACGSITDFTALVPAQVSVGAVNEAFRTASASGPLSAVLDYTEDPIVSSDVLGNPASCIFDAGLTIVQPIGGDQTLVKANGWYDNEWGYANRLVDLVLLVGRGQ
ncbi:MAG TPA: type I glyceraldehyde-3-phosphate dehydrogenase [Acidimicrobiales bacterium]|nr:type I glyceraldehyde-3-phosphate dehydrogenase [Acidimicrobiales bacterium]